MKIHCKKIKKEYYQEIVNGNKTFEIRKNDCDYQVGDLIKFEVIDEDLPGNYAAWGIQNGWKYENALWKITYILQDVPEYGLKNGYCIFSIKPYELVEVKEEPKYPNLWNPQPQPFGQGGYVIPCSSQCDNTPNKGWR